MWTSQAMSWESRIQRLQLVTPDFFRQAEHAVVTAALHPPFASRSPVFVSRNWAVAYMAQGFSVFLYLRKKKNSGNENYKL
jgi:hypothetical protein